MGYDVHITRADDWTESEEHPIAFDEWIAYMHADPEMRLVGPYIGNDRDDKTVKYEDLETAVWLKYSRHSDDESTGAWFDYENGEIKIKNPDHEILLKMYQIATALGAKVQGDDGEVYDEEGRAE